MDVTTTEVLAGHGLPALPKVHLDSYNLDVKEGRTILNTMVRRDAFYEKLDAVRAALRPEEKDPFGEETSAQLGRKKLELALLGDNADAADLLRDAIDEFAADIALVVEKFLASKEWKGVERIVVGGGFRRGRIGESCIRRADKLLRNRGIDVELLAIRHDPDEAGLIGAAHLLPSWTLKGHTHMLAVDIGGTNLRAGLVAFNLDKASDLSKAKVWRSEVWRHADDSPKRTATVQTLIDMLDKYITKAAEAGHELAPVMGIGCPGVIGQDGSIVRGAMNLPGGNWESEHFNLPQAIMKNIKEIGKHRALVVVHNDAVVQGLSQLPWMDDVKRWGILTIGTGLGNACFTNRDA